MDFPPRAVLHTRGPARHRFARLGPLPVPTRTKECHPRLCNVALRKNSSDIHSYPDACSSMTADRRDIEMFRRVQRLHGTAISIII